MTAPHLLEQLSKKHCKDSIPEKTENFNSLEEFFRKQQLEEIRQMDKSYLKTATMAELYDNILIFESEAELIEGLLYQGS